MSDGPSLDTWFKRVRESLWKWRWPINCYAIFLAFVYTFNRPTETDTDNLAISITVLEVFLAVIAVGGFWLFRRDVRDKAEEIAREQADTFLDRWERDELPPAVRRIVEEWLDRKANESEGGQSVADLVRSIGESEDDGNGQNAED